jgi:polysaccharide export outer membrane protein
MKCLGVPLLAIALANLGMVHAQETANHGSAAATTFSEGSNLPVERIGRDDLVGITVYDAPELTRTVRVGSDGDIRLPMVLQLIPAAGLYPAELETAIVAALTKENILVDPVVTVSVVEYRSRPITIAGEVRSPMTFQATGTVTLLDAISRAGGLTENAGAEILVSKPSSDANAKTVALLQRIPVRGLMDGTNPALNLHLEGGEDIRIPEAGRVFVLGRVKRPGSFFITDGSESSVMKALALSEGLDTFPSTKAYIYRVEGGSGGRSEIPIQLKNILNRKSPDVPLMANDIFYVPEASGKRASLKVLEASIGVGTALAVVLLSVYH